MKYLILENGVKIASLEDGAVAAHLFSQQHKKLEALIENNPPKTPLKHVSEFQLLEEGQFVRLTIEYGNLDKKEA